MWNLPKRTTDFSGIECYLFPSSGEWSKINFLSLFLQETGPSPITQSCIKRLLVVRNFCFWAVWAAGPVLKKPQNIWADYEQLLRTVDNNVIILFCGLLVYWPKFLQTCPWFFFRLIDQFLKYFCLFISNNYCKNYFVLKVS